MGFGFVVDRFGLFLRRLEAMQGSTVESAGVSVWFGTGLLVLGVAVNLMTAWRHRRLVHELAEGVPPRARPVAQASAIAIILAVIGLALAIYLISARNAGHTSSLRSPEFLAERHGVPAELLPNIAVVGALAAKAGE